VTLPPSPFKGLAYFGDSETDRRFFFGRERESELVAANLMASRLTVLYGPTGVGKSSLLRAGVAQRLRSLVPVPAGDSDSVEVVVVDSWRDDPLAAVASAAGLPVDVPLADALAGRAGTGGGELYLVLDQMEEYVLYHGRDGGPLADALEDVLLRPDVPVHVLLGVRDDSLADLDAFKRRVPSLFANLLRLDHLTRAAARSAIEGPLRAYAELGGPHVVAEPELVETLLDQVAAGRIEQTLTGRGLVEERERGHRVEAPYLQLVLERLWQVERERGSETLHATTLAELGGAEHIVEEHLASALGRLDDTGQDLAARLFDQLVTPSGSKIAHSVDDLARYAGVEPAELTPVLGTLDTARVLRRIPGRSGGPHRYEIFHDVLAQAVLAWRTRHEAARALAAEQAAARRRHRKLALVAAASLVALAATLALAVWALAQRSEARDQARSAEARELAASALSQLTVDPERSLRLALRAAELEPSERTEAVLRRALLDSRVRLRANVDSPVAALARGADGVIAAASPTAITVFDSDLAEIARRPLPGRLLELRSDGAVAVSGRTVTIFDPATGRVERRVRIPAGRLPVRDVESGKLVASITAPKTISHAALGPQRTLLAISDGSRKAVIVNTLNGEGRHVLEQPSAVTSLRFGPAARTLAVGGKDGTVRLWRVSTGEQRGLIRGHRGHVRDIAFSPRATLLATASTDGTARVWRVGSGELVSVLPGHENFVNDVEFSANGSFVATTGRDGTARVWRAENGETIVTLRGHADEVDAAAFLPGDRRVVTAGVEGTVRVWDSIKQPPLRLVRALGKPVKQVGFAGDGFEAVTEDGRLHVLSADGDERAERQAEQPGVERAPDGSTLRIAGKTAVIRRPNGRELVLRGHRDIVTSARFSPDGAHVVTASRDHVPIMWDARSGAAVRKLHAHFGIVSDARFSPDGRWIVTAGPGKPGLWDASTGELIYLFQGHEDILLSAAFDSTSRRIVTGGRDGRVHTYRCTICGHLDELIPLARARLGAGRPG
jgi:WD40 repeat protein